MVPDALSGGPHFAAYCERYIRHTKGRCGGRPLIYEDWQREFWWEALEFDPATGLRIYNEVGLGIPRKNTKSTMASAAGLYMLDDGKYLGAQFARLRARGALLEWRRYHLSQFVGFEDAWLRDGAWRATEGDLPLNTALPIGVGIDKSPGGEQGAVAIAQRQAERVVVRAQVFAAESATGMASTEAMRVRLRDLRAEFPLPQARDERTKRAHSSSMS